MSCNGAVQYTLKLVIKEAKENPESQKKTRRKLTDIQRSALEDFAKWKITPSLEARRTLADQVGL